MTHIHVAITPSLHPLSLGKGPPSLAWIAGSWKTRGESEWRRGPAPTIHRVITCICVRIKIEQMTTNYNLLYKRLIFVFLYLWENQDWSEDQCLDNNIFLAATTLTILIIFIHPSTLLAPWFRSYLILSSSDLVLIGKLSKMKLSPAPHGGSYFPAWHIWGIHT